MPQLLLIAMGDDDRLDAARHALAGAGWTVLSAASGDAAELVRETCPALVVVDGDGGAAAALVRVLHGVAPVPVVLLADAEHAPDALGACGPDAVVAAATPAALAVELQPWWPLAADPVRERLAAMLGRVNYLDLVARFGAQLDEALAAMRGGEPAAGRAHRIAGLAGTLGFAEVCEAWLPLSEGAADGRTAAVAAAAARRALQVIAHMPDQNC